MQASMFLAKAFAKEEANNQNQENEANKKGDTGPEVHKLQTILKINKMVFLDQLQKKL